jgi:hypothetical protein
MSTLREAAQQALEALMWCEPCCEENPRGFEKWAAVMPVLKEALAEPQPDLEAAVKKERECCAQLCEVLGHALDATWRSCADAIRARGDEK